MIRRDPVNHANTSREFLLQEIAFVQELQRHRIQHQHSWITEEACPGGTCQNKLNFRQRLGGADGLPEQHAVLQTVDPAVFRKLFVETVDRREENNSVDVVEVRVPCDPLRARPADVVDAPLRPRRGPCQCEGRQEGVRHVLTRLVVIDIVDARTFRKLDLVLLHT